MRDPLGKVSVKIKLTMTFVVLGVLAFGIGGYLVSGPSRRALEQEILGRLESQSIGEALLIDGELSLLARRLEDFSSDGYVRTELARLGTLADPPPEERVPLLRHLRGNKMPLIPALVDLLVLDGNGRRVTGVAAARPDEEARLAPAGSTPATWIGELLPGTTPRDPVVFAVAAPVFDLAHERRVGSIVAWVDVRRWLGGAVLPTTATETDPEDQTRLTLRDGAGNVLDVPYSFRVSGGQTDGLRLRALGAEEARRESLAHSGRHACTGGREAFGKSYDVRLHGWSVAVEREAAPALAAVSGLEARFIGIGILMALLCGVLFFFPLRFLVQPLVRLHEFARHLQRGDYARRFPLESEDEIGQLARTMNHVAAAVESRTEELRTERDRLGLVIRSMTDGLVFLDASGRVALSNEAAQPLVRALEGKGECSFLERTCAGRPAAATNCTECLRSDAVPVQACTVELAGSTLEVHSSRLPGGGGRVLVARDVTERVREEAHQAHQERLAVIGEVAAVVAHELNNPLAAITMFVQMLEQELPSESPWREHATVIARNAETCKRTIRGLLEFASSSEPEIDELDLHAVLRETAQFLAPLRQRAKIELVQDLAAKDALMTGDEVQLRQVFVNLVLNAIQAQDGNGGTIRIATREAGDGGTLVIDFEDDGPGIPPELQKRIFETFFTTKRHGSGTGLGLPIARRLAEAHGGSLELAESRKGRTVFRVTLPRRARPSPARKRPLSLVTS